MNSRTTIQSEEDLDSAFKRLDANDPSFRYIGISGANANETEDRVRSLVAHIGRRRRHHLTHLESIEIWGVRYTDVHVNLSEEIASLIRQNLCCLESLGIYSCLSGSCHAIADSLLQNSHIKFLDLYCCAIGDVGANILSKVLGNSSCALQQLLLPRNGIGDRGCASIMFALSNNNHTSLKLLDLRRNRIGMDGCRAVAKALQNNNGAAIVLEMLSLNHNRNIHNDGCICIAQALECNTSLKILDLQGCPITHPGWVVMERVLRDKNYSLHDLFMDDDSIYKNVFMKLLCLNVQRPVEAEAIKTGIFPHRLLNHGVNQPSLPSSSPLSQQGSLPSSCEGQMLAKVVSYGNLSVLFHFVQEHPSFLTCIDQ